MTDSPRWLVRADEDANLLRISLEGRFELQDWLRLLGDIPGTLGFDPEFNSLVDAREARFEFSYEDVLRLVVKLRGYLVRRGGGGFRSAYVVDSDLDFGISRMVQTLSEELPLEARVFRSVMEAESWLRDVEGTALQQAIATDTG